MTAFNVFTKLASAIWFVISSQMPTCGVTNPRQRLKLMIMPNCNVSMPNAFSNGRRIGVIMMIAAFASINMPITRNRRFSRSNTITLLSVTELNSANT